MINRAGKFVGRAVEALLIKSKEKGTPGVQVNFTITQGEFEKEIVRWDGWLTDKTSERTIESLQHCGWQNDDISVFARQELDGIDRNEVQLVIEMEEYQGEDPKYQGKSFPRVAWVNRLGGAGLNVTNAMAEGDALAFADKIKGLVHKVKATRPAAAGGADDSFNFGANTKPTGTAGKQF